jgi:hypothetical protein
MIKTRDREKLKLEQLSMERSIFEKRVEMREIKRRLGENDGDEDLLVGRKEKRRKRDDASGGVGYVIVTSKIIFRELCTKIPATTDQSDYLYVNLMQVLDLP